MRLHKLCTNCTTRVVKQPDLVTLLKINYEVTQTVYHCITRVAICALPYSGKLFKVQNRVS